LRGAAGAAAAAQVRPGAGEATALRQRAALQLDLIDILRRGAAEAADGRIARAYFVEQRARRRRAGQGALHRVTDPAAELVDLDALRPDLIDVVRAEAAMDADEHLVDVAREIERSPARTAHRRRVVDGRIWSRMD